MAFSRAAPYRAQFAKSAVDKPVLAPLITSFSLTC